MSRPARGLAAAVASLAVLVPLTVSAPAQAAPRTVPSRITYTGHQVDDDQTITVRGAVRSAKAYCRRGRTVTLVRTDDRTRAGSARTSRRGAFRIRFDGARTGPGAYRMTVRRKVVEHQGRRVVCGAASTTRDLV